MSTFFVISVALILGGVYWWLRTRASPEAVAYMNGAFPLDVSPIAEAGVARFNEERREQDDRDARAYEWLAETQRQFAPILVTQTAAITERGRQLGWSQPRIKGGVALIRSTYDDALEQEVKCACRLFGVRATRDDKKRAHSLLLFLVLAVSDFAK